MLIQQGDVLLQKTDKVPLDAKKVTATARGYVLAEGEVTGHAHVIESLGIEVYEINNMLFIKNSETVKIKHEEHKTVEIPAGFWRVKKVLEYDHFAEEVREIKD